MALASEVDKRRKSSESSPARSQEVTFSPKKFDPSPERRRSPKRDDPPPPLYSPNSPCSSLSPALLSNGRPPTPQSPPAPPLIRTPPISSPPPTPSPDHIRSPMTNHCGEKINSPPSIVSRDLTVDSSYDQHHFKKKFYHKDKFGGPPGGVVGYDDNVRYSSNYQHQSSHPKFRPKGKDWHWKGNAHQRRSPSHNYPHYYEGTKHIGGGTAGNHNFPPGERPPNMRYQLLTTVPAGGGPPPPPPPPPSRQQNSHHRGGYYSHLN